MALEDKALGVLLMAIAVVAFVYYTLWNLVLVGGTHRLVLFRV